MREIKFRAWDGREMEFDITVGCHSKDGKGARNTVVIIDDGACWFAQEEPYNAIMQYTGLKDKNGKEIYEGDILELEGGADEPAKGPVIFEYGCFCLEAPWIKNGRHQPELKHYIKMPFCEVEVLGNIYENPELLTK